MLTINLLNKMPDEQANALAATLLEEDSFDTLIQEDANVYKPNGELLIAYRKNVLPMDVCGIAWQALRNAPQETTNRGMAAGLLDAETVGGGLASKKPGKTTTKFRPRKKDGKASRTNVGKPVSSGIIGFMDRYPRMPYCRMTAFNIDHHAEFAAALPYVYAVNDVYKANVPERYQAQLAMIEQTSPDFFIKNTVFTTITVNKTFRTAVHKDQGDLKEGFGCMSVLEAGSYQGAYLVFPAFRVAVDMRTAGVCLADVHEWHGNTPITGKGQFERISCIFYYRANMVECGSAEQELDRVKNRKQGDHLYDKEKGE